MNHFICEQGAPQIDLSLVLLEPTELAVERRCSDLLIYRCRYSPIWYNVNKRSTVCRGSRQGITRQFVSYFYKSMFASFDSGDDRLASITLTVREYCQFYSFHSLTVREYLSVDNHCVCHNNAKGLRLPNDPIKAATKGLEKCRNS
jgi:hypothetical protein